jgi:capsular exopolysaccharide synthesis family protein
LPALNRLPETAHQDDLVDWLSQNLVIRAVGESEIYTIGFTCTEPRAASEVVNAVVDSYFTVRADEHGRRVKRVIDILEAERGTREKDVEVLRQGVRELAQRITGKDPFNSSNEAPAAEATAATDLRNRLISLEVEESILQAKVNAYKEANSAANSEVSDDFVEKSVASDPQVVAAMQDIADKKAKLSQFASKAARGKDEPAYQQAAAQVTEEEQAIEAYKAALKNQTKEKLGADRLAKVETELRSLQTALLDCQVTRELLQVRYQNELKNRKQSTGDTITLRFKQEELAREEQVLALISERIVQLETEQGAPPRVWEMEDAIVPTKPVKSVPYLNMLVVFAIGLGAPFGLAVLKEQLTARILDADALEQRAKLAVVGEIAQIPHQRRDQAHLGERDLRAVGLFDESVDAMRSNLLLSADGHSLRFIAVASAVKEEGKTTVAVQLAASIARSCGVRTLIIDGDMRDPSIHGVFEVPREPGLTDVLSGQVSLRDAIAVTRIEGVDVLAAGVLKGNPHALLAKGRWESLLAKVPREYQYVIIDTPPVLAASEALALVRNVDTVLMCALRDVTRLPQLQKAADRIKSTGARMGGMILNGIPTSHYATRYGTYSYLLQR